MNTFGTIFTLTTFGESHGPAIGGVIDGVPPGIAIDLDAVQAELNRRRPGQSAITTGRCEADKVEFLSGLLDRRTEGTPIGFIIRNADHQSDDYGQLRHSFRPSHADYTYTVKYGIRDYRGGGRSSARETACRVVGGTVARQILASQGITIRAYTSQVGTVVLDKDFSELDLSTTESNPVRCPDACTAERMIAEIKAAKTEGDTVGGVVTCIIDGCPAGLGEPIAGKLQARLASAMLSINAAKGFDYGMGFEGAARRGSEVIDVFEKRNGRTVTLTNHSGGIQGGISNGMPVYFRVAFKPVATLLRPVPTIDDEGNAIELTMKGRHDPCVVPRAVPVVEAMTAMTVLDMLLISRASL